MLFEWERVSVTEPSPQEDDPILHPIRTMPRRTLDAILSPHE
jgi:hypothetical protein